MFKLNYMELIQSAKDLIIIWLIIIKVFVVEKKTLSSILQLFRTIS